MSLDTARQNAINAIKAAFDYGKNEEDPEKIEECFNQIATMITDAIITMVKQGIVQVNAETHIGSMT